MSSEDTEWELLDKRLKQEKEWKESSYAPTTRRLTIKLDEDRQDKLIELFNGDRHEVTFFSYLIEGMLKTEELVQINIISTDGDES